MSKGIELLKTVTIIILVTTVIICAEYAGLHGNPHNPVPSSGGEIEWNFPIILEEGWMYFSEVHTDPQICEDDIIALMDDPTIPRRSAMWGDKEIAVTSACVATYLGPTVNSIREAIADAESRTGHPYTDEDVALVLRNFLGGITYESDDCLRGCIEYWATPAETLYAGRGDCDDQAILFATLGRIFGLDTAIIISPEHAQGGVRLESPNEYPTVDGYVVVECCSERKSRVLTECDDWLEDSYAISDGVLNRLYSGYISYLRGCAEWLNPLITVIYDMTHT